MARGDHRVAFDVGAAEPDAVIGGSGMNRQARGTALVQAGSGKTDDAFDCRLHMLARFIQ